MRLIAVVPVKSLDDGKSRLAGALSHSERRALNETLLAHTLRVASAFPGAGSTVIVSADEAVLALARRERMLGLRESGAGGLNGALDEARARLRESGACALLIVPSDLPLATPEDLREVARRHRAGSVVIAGDRRGEGTNALCIEAHALFTFGFGAASLARHREQARANALDCIEVVCPRLGFDVDTPGDLEELGRYLHTPSCSDLERLIP